MNLTETTDALLKELAAMTFGPPVTHVYNPLVYARESWELYLERYGTGRKEVVLLGMNPGPWGMAQTGVPFGEVNFARDWLGLERPVGRPAIEHAKRKVTGFACPRKEVSGQRVWGWAQKHFGTPEAFFARFFVANHCPLAFLEAGGRNRTPDKLPRAEREPLLAACDLALRRTVCHLQPKFVVGIGKFALARAEVALADLDIRLGSIPHPSPANPAANRGWDRLATDGLRKLGVAVP
jgi:single-strand selective monofunctional uracil DNA glycosylase